MHHATTNDSKTVTAAAADIEVKVRALLPLLDELERSLVTESRALASRDAQALLEAVETKRRDLRSLEAALTDTNLMALLEGFAQRQEGSGPGARDRAQRDARAWLKHELVAAAVPSWHPLLERLRRCRSLNQAAGGATAALQRHTQEGLRLLGLSPEPCTYGTSGRTQAPVSALPKPIVA
jgi:flagellar biosynthesis/type III secretory pathway chaperone